MEDYLSAELRQEKIVKFSKKIPDSHFSPFGVIPKKNRLGKWRLIVDLSAPDGLSVNDTINKEWCSLSYISVDDMIQCILQKGKVCIAGKAGH